ncbi:MAG: hypothetical protein CVU73_12115 [Deltaproteobacteria bacterium HGW-Deltaproteobacteria-8]|jgi:hypothetical protein|nr:MAG: hypothetical protein CVU73_12115 [Deltaproteobacteria bacterium HGW-Deltaproteobacteria-8]
MARTIRIKAQPHAFSSNGAGRFCRAGRCFGTVPMELAEGDFTPEQLAAWEAEPMLVVEIVEDKAKADAKAGAKAEVKADIKPAADTEADAEAKADAKPEAKPEAKAEAKPAAKEGGK